MATRKIHLRLARLPSGLASYPRVVLTRRPDLLTVVDPPEIEVRVSHVRFDVAQVARYSAAALAELLGPDFVPVHALTHVHTTPGGAEQQFAYALFAREATS